MRCLLRMESLNRKPGNGICDPTVQHCLRQLAHYRHHPWSPSQHVHPQLGGVDHEIKLEICECLNHLLNEMSKKVCDACLDFLEYLLPWSQKNSRRNAVNISE